MNDEARGLLLVWTDIPGELESDLKADAACSMRDRIL